MPWKDESKHREARLAIGRRYRRAHAAEIRARSAERRRRNLATYAKRMRDYRARQPAVMARIDAKRRLARYGITVEEKAALLTAQGNLCANPGCRTAHAGPGGHWHVDHDHATGEVRGILCHGCNVALGFVRDSPERLRGLAAYLEDPPAPSALRVARLFLASPETEALQ